MPDFDIMTKVVRSVCMIKFALVASGSKGNCCIVKNNESSIIIDCGSTKRYLTQSFERLQYNHNDSDALFITHAHSDHVAQLKMFQNIPVYSKASLDIPKLHLLEDLSEVFLPSLHIQEIPLSHDSGTCSGYIVTSHTQKLVYITDTGYIKDAYYSLLSNADYYIFESNHDVEMLMKTNRPYFTKQRIISDEGHLCNEDSAYILSQLVGENTKEIVLAHLSEEGNHPALAYNVLHEVFQKQSVSLDAIKVRCAKQFEIVIGGERF